MIPPIGSLPMLVAALVAGFFAASPGRVLAQSFSDDFTGGPKPGWQEFDPISSAGFSPNVEFIAENGTYRLNALESPAPGAVGQARGAVLRPEVYADFCLVVDVPNFDITAVQAFGFLARVQGVPTVGDVDGYVFTYHPADNDIQINRIENEQVVQPEISPAVALSPRPTLGQLRLVFFSDGSRLVGRAYDSTDPTTPLAETQTIDMTHTSGICGLLVADNIQSGQPGFGMGTADATFDNYFARPGVGVPDSFSIEVDVDDVELRWRFPFLEHDAAFSSALSSWLPIVDDGEPTYLDGEFLFLQDVLPGGAPAYYRLQRRPIE